MPWVPGEKDGQSRWLTPLFSEAFGQQWLQLTIIFFCIQRGSGKTFFQPDEYYQALEPAWDIAFGPGSGAWVTWEWRERLRSSLHPYIFATFYWIADALAQGLGLNEHRRAEILVYVPNIPQAVFAATILFGTLRFSTKYDHDQSKFQETRLLILVNTWHSFLAQRTFVNTLEAALTSVAVYYWPWELVLGVDANRSRAQTDLRTALFCASLASILRPTNVIIWLVFVAASLYTAVKHLQAGARQYILLLIREGLLASSCVAMVTSSIDRIYYGMWTFPPYRFLHFNLVQSLAVFYGSNRRDYYFTEGIPLLMTFFLPFFLYGSWRVLSNLPASRAKVSPESSTAQRLNQIKDSTGLIVIISMIVILSSIAHKEARFIYPLFPLMISITATGLAHFRASPRLSTTVKIIIVSVLSISSIALEFYLTTKHQSGVIAVTHYLRHEYETSQLPRGTNMTVAFLMPCHSTPWRSHLVYPQMDAWALTCPPPIGLSPAERAVYVDEADEFYLDPKLWLYRYMRPNEVRKSETGKHAVHGQIARRRAWPEYLVFFEQLEPTLQSYFSDSVPVDEKYEECWRSFNSHFHDDWRRTGDVVVWCKR